MLVLNILIIETSNYTYDSDNKVYLRGMNGTKNVDLVTGEQYKVKNIIIYGVNYSNYCQIMDTACISKK